MKIKSVLVNIIRMEMVAQTINLLNGHSVDFNSVVSGEIETHVLGGLAPVLVNSSGEPWTANYVTVTGDLVADLLSNIASEQRAKVVYEYCILIYPHQVGIMVILILQNLALQILEENLNYLENINVIKYAPKI